ncbi:hypothetical protein PoB_001607800 [Plakobranchus ocellatus]|uniref:Uncharacterized protein n=1 Tax=Plakobranchus ocellatus TaxID=259542 RepID=A0AAV3Z551_9GAST|nr:hypothetical protein PoB_001607800 [Plakobranchus ocellatus]
MDSESALRFAGTLLSRVRAPPPAPWPEGGPESLISSCCGFAIYKEPNLGELKANGGPKLVELVLGISRNGLPVEIRHLWGLED